MQQIKIYICGPMTGLPGFNYPAFNAAEKQLRAAGYDALNPVNSAREITAPRAGMVDAGGHWKDYMRNGINQLIRADKICYLPGWEDSRGATLEMDIAEQLQIDAAPLEHWINRADRAHERMFRNLVHAEKPDADGQTYHDDPERFLDDDVVHVEPTA